MSARAGETGDGADLADPTVAASFLGSDGADAATALDDTQFMQLLEVGQPLLACVMPLLSALNWTGSTRRVAEALPHYATEFTVDDLRRTFANLGYATHRLTLRLDKAEARFAPFIFIRDDGTPLVVTAATDAGWHVFDGGTGAYRVIAAGGRGTAYFPQRAKEPATDDANWLSRIAPRFRGLIYQMLTISVLTGVLGLATPLFIMAIYDNVIAMRAPEVLPYLAGGLIGAIAVDAGLRMLRARLLAHVGGRMDNLLGLATFHQIVYLPLSSTVNAAVGTQLARLKQFESLRDFFTGPLAGVVLDIPTIAVFLAALWLIAPPVAWVPLVLLVLFIVAGLCLAPIAQRAARNAATARARKQQFLIETLSNMTTIRAAGVEDRWSERFRDLAADSTLHMRRSQRVSAVAHAVANALMLGAGVATLYSGTHAVIADDLSVGALVAAMAIVWRMLTPLQTGFVGLTKAQQLRQSMQQFNQLMRLKRERNPVVARPTGRILRGGVAFKRVGYRPPGATDPALLGVSFDVNPGELVAVTGPAGSGKSSLLDLVAGLLQPQTGAVELDGVDLRQHDPGELRRQLGYLPQGTGFFYGTVAQNLSLTNPLASNDAMRDAARAADCLDDILALAEGFDTQLTESVQQSLSAAFAQKLLLARTYLAEGRVLLLDDPSRNLDEEGELALRNHLEALRGHTTVIFTTQRQSQIALADKVFVLDRGQLLASGPPDRAVPTAQRGR